MPSYATLARRMEGNLPGEQQNGNDFYKSDRKAIEDFRVRLAKDLWLSDLRFQMEVARWRR